MKRRYSISDRLRGLDSTQDEPGDEYFFNLKHETDKAWLVTDSEFRELWLPKSVCSRVAIDGKLVALWVPDWLAEEKGLV